MTGNNILLDTNIVIELFKGDAKLPAVLDKYATVYVPAAVLGELYLGAYRSTHTVKHLKQISGFLERCEVLGADLVTADNYGEIKATLLKKGKPIPENDIWIAATARQYTLKLFTKDKHFKEVEGITLKHW
jgi:tRNA(fMet)-specific endonuclease VapC